MENMVTELLTMQINTIVLSMGMITIFFAGNIYIIKELYKGLKHIVKHVLADNDVSCGAVADNNKE